MELANACLLFESSVIQFAPRQTIGRTESKKPQQILYERLVCEASHSANVETYPNALFISTGKVNLKSVTVVDTFDNHETKPCALNGVKLSPKLTQKLQSLNAEEHQPVLNADPEKFGFSLGDEAFFQLYGPVARALTSWEKEFYAGHW